MKMGTNKVILLGVLTLLFISTKVEKGLLHNPINETLLHNIARVESNHNPKAVSKKGALGVYQIRYSVWEKELKKNGIIKGRKCLFDPKKNKDAAIFILNTYWYKTKDLNKTLHKYSGGAKNYADKVLNGEN